MQGEESELPYVQDNVKIFLNISTKNTRDKPV